MTTRRGYYSLVQYCPDFARQEAANVGVVLFCPDAGFLRAKLAKNNHRIRRFFGEEADNYQHLNAMKEALAARLQVEREEFQSLEDMQTFVATRANKIILTPPKPVKVFDPEADLVALYQELVQEPRRPLSIQSSLPLRYRLDEVLQAQSVRAFMRTGIKVCVPTLKEELEIPYGYQNGRFNLIKPIEFNQQSPARIKSAACRTAMEGLSLYRHADPLLGALQLVAVCDFTESNRASESMVHDIFREGAVEVYRADALDELIREIIAHGKPVPREETLFSDESQV